MRYLAYLLVLLSGCASYPTIDYSNAPPADWPELRVITKMGSADDVRLWCAALPEATPPAGAAKFGCALVYFDIRICRVYLTSDDPDLVKHETDHCKGYVHHGEGDRAHRAWRAWKYK